MSIFKVNKCCCGCIQHSYGIILWASIEIILASLNILINIGSEYFMLVSITHSVYIVFHFILIIGVSIPKKWLINIWLVYWITLAIFVAIVTIYGIGGNEFFNENSGNYGIITGIAIISLLLTMVYLWYFWLVVNSFKEKIDNGDSSGRIINVMPLNKV